MTGTDASLLATSMSLVPLLHPQHMPGPSYLTLDWPKMPSLGPYVEREAIPRILLPFQGIASAESVFVSSLGMSSSGKERSQTTHTIGIRSTKITSLRYRAFLVWVMASSKNEKVTLDHWLGPGILFWISNLILKGAIWFPSWEFFFLFPNRRERRSLHPWGLEPHWPSLGNREHSRAACKADRQCVQSTKHHHYPSGLQFSGDIPDKLILDMLMEAGIGSLGCEGRVVTRAPCEGCC